MSETQRTCHELASAIMTRDSAILFETVFQPKKSGQLVADTNEPVRSLNRLRTGSLVSARATKQVSDELA